MERFYNVVAILVKKFCSRCRLLVSQRMETGDAAYERGNGGNRLLSSTHDEAQITYGEPVIARFAHGRRVFVASNIKDDKELRLVTSLANRYRNTPFIFIPYEISSEGLRRIKYELAGRTLLYSECDEATDFKGVQTLVVDFLGASTYIYRYATWTYIGGGSATQLRSVIGATLNGVPMAFGKIASSCKELSLQLIGLGIGRKISSLTGLTAWFEEVKDNETLLTEIREKAKRLVSESQSDTMIAVKDNR